MGRINTRLSEFKKVSGEQWLALLSKVPAKHRHHVAYVVWWDWFSGKDCTDRWPHLDQFLYKPDRSEPCLEAIVSGLVTCGYTQEEAVRRIEKKNNH